MLLLGLMAGQANCKQASVMLPTTYRHQYMICDCFAPGTGGAEGVCGGWQGGSRL